jgi:hypothetical protein
MGAYMGESWDGFDGRDHVYDEKKDKKWNSGIWKLIGCLAALMLIYIFVNHMKDILLEKQGICLDAEYDEEKMVAIYQDENGQSYTYYLSGYKPESRDGRVKLYYRHNIRGARPRNSTVSFIKNYCFFVVILAISVWRIWKIYKK